MSKNRSRDALTFCSIIPQDHLPQARALAASVRSHHPNARLFVLLLDPPEGPFPLHGEAFSLVSLQELDIPDLPGACFRLKADELARAIRPWLLASLLRQPGVRKVVHLPADTTVLTELSPLGWLLDRYPVIATPESADSASADLIALARGEAADTFLDEWKRQPDGSLPRAARDAIGWIDPVPGRLRRHGGLPGLGQGYRWGFFDNGVAIPDLARQLYRDRGPAAAAHGNPFTTAGAGSFYTWLTSFAGTELPPLVRAVYDSRADLAHHFPEVNGKHRRQYLEWLLDCGAAQKGIDPRLLAQVSRSIGRLPDGLEQLDRGRRGIARDTFGVNVLGFLQSEKGVGEACRTTIRALRAANVPLVLNNWVEMGSANVDVSLSPLTDENPYPINLVHVNADGVLWAARRIPWYFRGRYNIGFWNWELEWFPPDWNGSFQHLDEIWAPSVFTRDSIARVSPVPVHCVPYAIHLPPLPPGAVSRQRFGLPADAFVFLFAFDFQSYLARKNPGAAIEAFRRAFGNRRDVVLALKTSHGEKAPRDFAEVVAACRGQANIRILRQVLPREDMLALLHVCDAYVSLHRSEGFGLPIAEAMAAGKPVVATHYSGNVDFMNDSNSFPVRYRRVAIDDDHGPYRRGAEWADPDVDHAAEQMRRLVDTPGLAIQVGARARTDAERMLRPQAVGRIVQERLAAIRASLQAVRRCA